MSYEYDYELLDSLTDEYGLTVDLEDASFMYEADTKGMRALDYMPDMDDYEYQQSRYA